MICWILSHLFWNLILWQFCLGQLQVPGLMQLEQTFCRKVCSSQHIAFGNGILQVPYGDVSSFLPFGLFLSNLILPFDGGRRVPRSRPGFF